MQVLGVNGILSRGHGSTDRVLRDLRERYGYRVRDVPLPVRTALMAYWDRVNRADARRLVQLHRPGDAVVAHSRGALVVYWAMRLGAVFSDVFLFSPAIESYWSWPCRQAKRIHVVHHRGDRAIALGMLLALRHPFGALGREGYRGPEDPRITSTPATTQDGEASWLGHGSGVYFDDEVRPGWVEWIHERLRAAKVAA